MEKKQQELLERVLLLMKYDNKETLSENISKVKILTEQPDPNKVPKNQVYKDAITNCKMQPRNYTWPGFAPKNKESVDKFCNSLQLNYPSFYSKTPVTNNLNPQTTPKPKVLSKDTLRNYSIEQLINLYVSNTGKGDARVSAGTSKDNIISVFAEKVSQLSLGDLKNLINKNPQVFKSSLSFKEGSSISAPKTTKDFRYNVDKYGPLILLVDHQVFEKKIEQYNKNPKSFNYQPPVQPNWKDLIDKFGLGYLIQYQYSPLQYIQKEIFSQRGLKGYTQKGYPQYEKNPPSPNLGGYLNIQWALVDLGYLNEKDVSQIHSFGVNYKWYDSLKKYLESGDYEFGNVLFLSGNNDEQQQKKIIENIICLLKDKKFCNDSLNPIEMPYYGNLDTYILSFLRANLYPNIEPDRILFKEGDVTPKEQKEKFEQGFKNSKVLKISIYDVDGKIIPIYSRGDDPDLPTYSLESEGFELTPQTIFSGPVFSILTDEQVKTLVDWLSEWCTEPVEVNGVKYGRKIITGGGSGLNFDFDLYSKFPNFVKDLVENESLYPNCVVDFANKETNGDVGKWMIKFLKLPEEQIDLLLQFYPEDYDLIQTYLPEAPGSKDFYLNSPLVKNAVKMHILINPGFLGSLSNALGSGYDTVDKIPDSLVELTIKKLLECPGMHKELQAIAAGQREYKGYIVGQYYSSLKSRYVRYTIPCPDEWWDEHSWQITMGGVLLASFIFPPASTALGWELELAIVARMAVDVGLNLYSAYRYKLAGNEEMAKIELACAMLSFIVDTPGFEKTFLKGYGDWAEISVLNKIKKARPSSAKKWRQFVNSLSDVERRHLYDILNTPRFMRQIKVYGKKILDDMLKKQFGSQFKNLAVKTFRTVGIKVPVMFTPTMLNLGYKIFVYANQASQNIFKIPMDETVWKAFEWELKNRGLDTKEEINNFVENILLKGGEEQEKFLNSVGKKLFGEQTEKIKPQIPDEELNKLINEVKDLNRRIKELNKQMENELQE